MLLIFLSSSVFSNSSWLAGWLYDHSAMFILEFQKPQQHTRTLKWKPSCRIGQKSTEHSVFNTLTHTRSMSMMKISVRFFCMALTVIVLAPFAVLWQYFNTRQWWTVDLSWTYLCCGFSTLLNRTVVIVLGVCVFVFFDSIQFNAFCAASQMLSTQ